MPRVVDHDERRGEIVAAAMDLIEKTGPRALTMRNLAARLGVANGALDRYFPAGKAAIMDAVYTAAYGRVRVEVNAIIRDLEPGLDALRAMVTALMPVPGRVDGATVMLAFWNELGDVDEVRDRVGHDLAHMRDRFEQLLRVAAERGQVTDPARIPTAALTLVALVFGSYHVSLAMPGKAAAEGYAEAVDLVLAGV